ncbi:MAG: PepSY domain-containing protein [Leptolyngbya sp.]|nr:PepSY domain-containing protein [Candidatus Melainabacteria bacterium]
MKTLCSLLCLSIALVCGPAFAADQAKTAQTVTPKVSKKKAQEAAMKLVKGKLLRWDLEIQEGKPSYTFYIKSKDGRINEVALNGDTGEKDHIGIELEYGTKDGKGFKNSSDADKNRWKETKFSKDQAQVKALEANPGTVEAWELLIWAIGERGKLVYEYRIESKGERKVVCVDAMTGEILATSIFADGK